MSYFLFLVAKIYAYIYVWSRQLTGYNIPGLGFLLRLSSNPRYINFVDQKFYFNPNVASEYGIHIIGLPIEPETHLFLNTVFDNLSHQRKCLFVEVGANIGAFLIDLARRQNVSVIGFEPSSECLEAIKKTMEINHRNNYKLFQNLVGDSVGWIPFSVGKNVQGSSVYASEKSKNKIQQITLDNVDELRTITSETPIVLMIDVEGYEPKVLRGGKSFIARMKPLIVFEYNFVSKRYFCINEVQALLGVDYTIYRLRKDGFLDSETEKAWNCVAVPKNAVFDITVKSLVIK
jgi:FkbM family methyltransferase